MHKNIYKNKRWGDLSKTEQEYIIATSTKGTVEFEDLKLGFMPSLLYLGNNWAIPCYYTLAFGDLEIAIDPDAKFFKPVHCVLMQGEED